MTDITIPPEVKTAVGEVFSKCTCIHVGAEAIDAACLAMLNNWPGMNVERFAPWSKYRTIHLPLPPETRNE